MDEARAQEEINKYKKFRKVDGATYRKVNQFLRKRTYITAREWALARLCTDFRTTGGAEMTFIGAHLPQLVPFMEDTYSPQAVNQARNSFKKKVRKSSATFFYGAMCGFFTTEELDDLLFEASEVARFLLEVESTTLDIDEEIDIEDRITGVMRSVGEAAKTVLKTRGMEVEREDGAVPAAGEGAAAGAVTPPKVRPGAVRRGRKRKIRDQEVPAESHAPVLPAPVPGTPSQETGDLKMPGLEPGQPEEQGVVALPPGSAPPVPVSGETGRESSADEVVALPRVPEAPEPAPIMEPRTGPEEPVLSPEPAGPALPAPEGEGPMQESADDDRAASTLVQDVPEPVPVPETGPAPDPEEPAPTTNGEEKTGETTTVPALPGEKRSPLP